MQQPSAPDERILGGFRILREIGRGGMGVVYEAAHVGSGRRVALKVLEAHLTLTAAAIERFVREAHAAAALRHPHLVRVEPVRHEARVHFFAMELVEGASLAEIIAALQARADGGSAAQVSANAAALATWLDHDRSHRAALLLTGVARALDHAHRRGVLHRDVKPSNVLVRRDGHALLIDFGLAREEGMPALTHTGDLVGSPYYLAPEHVKGGHAPHDVRGDIYGLGVVLYELMTLRRPFEAATSHELLEKIHDGGAPPPRSLDPSIPAPLEAICLRAMAHAPRDRYESAAALARDLARFAAGRAVAVHATPWQRLRFRGSERGRRRTIAAGLAAALMVALLGIAWRLWPRPPIDEVAALSSAALDVRCEASGASVTVWSGDAATGEPLLRALLPLREALRLPPGRHALRLAAPGCLPRVLEGERAPELSAGATRELAVWLAPWESVLRAKAAGALVAALPGDARAAAPPALAIGRPGGSIEQLVRGADGRATAYLVATLAGELRALTAVRGDAARLAATVRDGEGRRVVALARDGRVTRDERFAASIALLRALDVDGDGRDELLVGEDVGRVTLLSPDDAEAESVHCLVKGTLLDACALPRAGALFVLAGGGLFRIAEGKAKAIEALAVPFRVGSLHALAEDDPARATVVVVDPTRQRAVGVAADGTVRFSAELGSEPIDAAAAQERLCVVLADGRAEWIDGDGGRTAAAIEPGAVVTRLLAGGDAATLIVSATARGLAARTLDGAPEFEIPARATIESFQPVDVDGDGRDELVVRFATGDVELLARAPDVLLRAGDAVRALATGAGATTIDAAAIEANGRVVVVDGKRGVRPLDVTGGAVAVAVAPAGGASALWVAGSDGTLRGFDEALRETFSVAVAAAPSGPIERIAALRCRDGVRIVASDPIDGLCVLTADGHREGRCLPRAGATLRDLATGDLDGDGDDEIATAWSPGGLLLFDHRLHPSRPRASPAECVALAFLAPDAQGRRVLATAWSDATLRLLGPRGELQEERHFGELPTALVAARASKGGDDATLLWVGSERGTVAALKRDGTFAVVARVAGRVAALATGDADGDGEEDVTALSIAPRGEARAAAWSSRGVELLDVAAARDVRGLALRDVDGDGVAELWHVGHDGCLEVRDARAGRR